MRKNKMMRAASGLLVATLLTTSVISGTFAKYVTQDSATDTARVAKWGVTLQVSGDLYSANYLTTNNTATDSNDGISVQGTQIPSTSTNTNVVAPGTKNLEGFKFAVKGTPEVSSQVTMDITAQNVFLKAGTYGVMVQIGKLSNETYTDLMGEYHATDKPDGGLYVYDDNAKKYTMPTSWDKDAEYYTLEDYVVLDEEYYPVVYNLSGDVDTEAEGTINTDSLAEIAFTLAKTVDGDSITQAITPNSDNISTYTDVSATYAPNKNLADANEGLNLDNVTITWEWSFENGSDDVTRAMYNGADTILGNLMAERDNDFAGEVVKASSESYSAPTEHTDYCLDTQFAVDITVEQVD